MSETQAGVPRFNVLTLDGGPAGMIQVRLLAELEAIVPGFLAATDLFGGSSDGAMILLFLASRLAADPAKAKATSRAILQDGIQFSNETLRGLHVTLGGMLLAMTGLRPVCDTARFRAALEGAFGDMTLGEIERKAIAVSFGLNAWEPRCFRWFGPMEKTVSQQSIVLTGDHSVDPDMTIVDVILASGSLPLVVSSFGDVRGHHYLDGAFTANNPSLVTLANVLSVFSSRSDADQGPATPEELAMCRLLSLGANDDPDEETQVLQGRKWTLSGMFGKPVTSPGPLPWGWGQWIMDRPFLLPDLLYQGQNSVVAMQGQMLLGPRIYHRFAPAVPAIQTVQRALIGDLERLFDTLDEQALVIRGTQKFADLVTFVKEQWIANRA